MDSKETKKQIGFKYAFEGIKYVFYHERNFRIHAFALLTVIVAGFLANINFTEWIFLFIVSGMVWITEMINSAIELLIDYIKPATHPSAKAIKDISAGAVLIAVIVAVIIGCIIFFPKLIASF